MRHVLGLVLIESVVLPCDGHAQQPPDKQTGGQYALTLAVGFAVQ